MAHADTEQPRPETRPPQNIARIFLPLTAAIAEFCPRRSIASIACKGLYASLSGAPKLYEVEAALPLGCEPPPDTVWGGIENQWQLTTAWSHRNLCELVSQLVADEANKYLVGKGYLAAPMRCKPMAEICILNRGAPVVLPNHVFVAIKLDQSNCGGDEWILDGTFPQFGQDCSPRFDHSSTYLTNFVDYEQFPVIRLNAQDSATLRTEINNSQYLNRVQYVTDQVLRSFPWDGSEAEQTEAVGALMDRVWPALKLAAI